METDGHQTDEPETGGPQTDGPRTDGMTPVSTYGTEADAREAAAALVAHGVGATVEPVSPGLAALGVGSGYGFCVAVLDADAPRACELLGLEPTPQPAEATEAEMTRSLRPLLIPVVLVGLAVLLVPVIAFFISFKMAGG